MSTQVSRPEAGKVGAAQIDPGTVELINLNFNRLQGDDVPSANINDKADITFELLVRRKSRAEVTVILGIKVVASNLATIDVKAGTHITVEFADEEDLDVERELANIAGQVGPMIIYPYLREAVADVTRRAGLAPLTLPIYQIGTFFKVDPADLQLAESPAEDKKPTKRAKKKALASGQ